MQNIDSQTFSNMFDRGGALLFENLTFNDCLFENCALSLTKDIQKRTTVRNLQLTGCKANGCDIGPAIFENVQVNGLATNDLLIVWGALFNRVRLAGNIGKLKLNHVVHHVDRTERTQGPFDRFRKSYYDKIEWALDIREARFKEFDVRGIPASKFLRDPETQVIVTREKALTFGWQKGLSSTNTLWPFMIRQFLSDGDEDMVLVVPLGAAKEKRENLLMGMRELRDLGVAE